MSKAFGLEKTPLLKIHLKPYCLYLPYLPGISVYVGALLGSPPRSWGVKTLPWTGVGPEKAGFSIYTCLRLGVVESPRRLRTFLASRDRFIKDDGFADFGICMQFGHIFVAETVSPRAFALLRLCSEEKCSILSGIWTRVC
jgi:hypothetical protein